MPVTPIGAIAGFNNVPPPEDPPSHRDFAVATFLVNTAAVHFSTDTRNVQKAEEVYRAAKYKDDIKAAIVVAERGDQDFNEAPPWFRASMDALEARMTAKMEGIEERMTAKMEGIEERMTAKIEGVETRMTAKIDGVETRMTTKMEGMEARMTTKMEEMETEITQVKTNLAKSSQLAAIGCNRHFINGSDDNPFLPVPFDDGSYPVDHDLPELKSAAAVLQLDQRTLKKYAKKYGFTGPATGLIPQRQSHVISAIGGRHMD